MIETLLTRTVDVGDRGCISSVAYYSTWRKQYVALVNFYSKRLAGAVTVPQLRWCFSPTQPHHRAFAYSRGGTSRP